MLDELNRLKAERRAEIAAAEEARRKAAEEARERFFALLNESLQSLLAQQGIGYIAEFCGVGVRLWDNDRKAEATFTLPGHRLIFLRMRLAQHNPDRWAFTDP
ncbi:hypothetical protein B7486_73555, partial [cyanobacterium TDX16]